MIDLTAIFVKLQELILMTKNLGEFDGGQESAQWTLGEYAVLEHNCLGTAFYIGEVQVWNNW
jgi:hypothetical protein